MHKKDKKLSSNFINWAVIFRQKNIFFERLFLCNFKMNQNWMRPAQPKVLSALMQFHIGTDSLDFDGLLTQFDQKQVVQPFITFYWLFFCWFLNDSKKCKLRSLSLLFFIFDLNGIWSVEQVVQFFVSSLFNAHCLLPVVKAPWFFLVLCAFWP